MKKGAAALAALLLLAGLHSWLRYFPSLLITSCYTTVLAAVTLAALYALGRKISELLKLDFSGETPLETAVAISLGLAALAYALLILGTARLFYPACAALTLGVFLWSGKKYFEGLKPGMDFLRAQPLLALSCALLGAAALAALAPVHEYDSLVYHMAMPQTYIQKHAVVFIKDVYGHFPQNGEMLFTFALLLKSPELAQLFGVLALGLTGLWLYAAPGFSSRAKILAILLTVSHTALFLLSSTTYVEPLVALWTTAAVISFLKWQDEADPARAKPWIILCGIFCGAGLGTKYYSGITAIALALMGLYKSMGMGWFSQKKTRVLHMGLFCALWAALFAPWLVKNFLSIGNPVFPFLHWVFQPAGHGIGADEAGRYFGILSEYGNKGGFLKEFFSFPYLAISEPGRYGGGMDVLGSLGWELLFAGAPLMALAAWKKPQLRWAAFYVLAHWLAWMLTGKVLRFLLVIAPLASLLVAEGFYLLWETQGRAIRAVMASALILLTGARLILVCNVKQVFGASGVLCGTESTDEFLARRLAYYPCARAFNETAQCRSKVLVAGDQRYYYLKGEAVPTSVSRKNDFVLMANSSPDARELRRKMLEDGYTHIIYIPDELMRLGPYGTINFTRPGMLNWLGLLEDSSALYAGEKCRLYELK